MGNYFKQNMKKIVLIQSHCNTNEKIEILKKNITELRKLDVDILLFSHIMIPSEVIESVDYFVYDKSNPILWEDRRHVHWWANDQIKLETSVPDYGWTVFNQIIKSYDVVRSENYDYFFLVCYDLIIDELVQDVINNTKLGTYRHLKPKNVDGKGVFTDVVFETSLIFLSLNEDQIRVIVENLNKKEYIEHPEWIAELYLEIILSKTGIKLPKLGDVKDLIHESTSVFNQSNNPFYEIFIDNVEPIKVRFIKKNNDSICYLYLNDEMVQIEKQETLICRKNDQIYNLGVFCDGKFDEMTESLSDRKKLNKIILL